MEKYVKKSAEFGVLKYTQQSMDTGYRVRICIATTHMQDNDACDRIPVSAPWLGIKFLDVKTEN